MKVIASKAADGLLVAKAALAATGGLDDPRISVGPVVTAPLIRSHAVAVVLQPQPEAVY